jgi:NADH dehydrogenase
MSERVVVLGAGYAGATAVQRLERELPDAELTWVSREDYHLVLHEVHRVVRDPSVADDVTIPVRAIAGRDTAFVRGEVIDLDTGARVVELADGAEIEYDYAVVALGSRTAFYGIPGLAEHAHTLKSLDDAEAIHEAVATAAADATSGDPARVVVGGAGLSGIQLAGEVAAYRDEETAPVDVTLVEAMASIMPGQDDALQEAVRRRVEAHDIEILTDDPIVEATDRAVIFDDRDAIDHDVLVWAGGVTGQEALADADLEDHHDRVEAEATFETTDDRVFALGDSALVEQGDGVAPPTAQAAWGAAEVAAANVRRAIEGEPLETWTYTDKGTLVSVGESAVAHDLVGVPVTTFDSKPAEFTKKLVAARWIAQVTTWRRALSAWGSL